MRTVSIAFLTLGLLVTPACESMGGMPTSLAGIAKQAGTLSTDLTGFLGQLDMGNLMGGALAPLSGYVDTGKSLLSGLNKLPEAATSGVDIGGLKSALGDIAGFDVDSLMSAAGGEKAGMLGQLKDAAMNLGSQAGALTGG